MAGDEIAATCNLIVTATPSHTPLLRAEQIRKGTHITAMGSDTREKNELEPAILRKADLVVADSIEQCRVRGEIFHALEAGVLEDGDILELGNVIVDPALRRTERLPDHRRRPHRRRRPGHPDLEGGVRGPENGSAHRVSAHRRATDGDG